METLQRISSLFENVKSALKCKNSSDRFQVLKRDIQTLGSELVVLGKENHEQFLRSLAMEGYLALLTAKTMPISIVEKKNILQVAFDKLKPFALKQECLFTFLRVQNLLCYLLIQTEQTDAAREILEAMEELYVEVGKLQSDQCLDAEDLFSSAAGVKPVHPDKVNKVITNNVQMQAYLYHKLNIPHKYALYNHTALRRQLETKDGTPQDWAVRAARLGNYFTYLNQMPNARHHLCAAYYVLRNCHDNCKLVPAEFILRKADFEVYFLELSHHWVKYGLALFKLSKKKVLNRFFRKPPTVHDMWRTVDFIQDQLDPLEKEPEEEGQGFSPENNDKGDYASEHYFRFFNLDLKEMEAKVPLEIVKNAEEARKLFSFTYKWLKRTKHYYDFENHSAQHIACSLQLAELYEHLAFFEKNIDRQYNLQKKRAEVLESLNSLLKSCDNVMSVQIDVIRELSQVQLELMALNLQKLWHEESHTNVLNLDNDNDSMIHSLDSRSSKTLTEKTLNASSRNMFLRKMEAATTLNGKLMRLSGHLTSPSELSFNIKN